MGLFNRKHYKRKPRKVATKSYDKELDDKFAEIIDYNNQLTDLFQVYMNTAPTMSKEDLEDTEKNLNKLCDGIESDIDYIREKLRFDKVADVAFGFNHPFYENMFEESFNGINLVKHGVSIIHAGMEERDGRKDN